jgi:hypothetical protein
MSVVHPFPEVHLLVPLILLSFLFSAKELKSNTMTMATASDDSEFQVQKTKKSPNNKRVYIGGLPEISDLEEKLRKLLKDQAQVEEATVTINSHGKSPHALVDCGIHADTVIFKLHRYEFEGKRLVVQREQRGGVARKKNGPKKFATWSQPSQQRTPIVSERRNPPADIHEVAENIGTVVANEFEKAEENGDDLINVAIASTAAASLLASMNAFAVDPSQDENAAGAEGPVSLDNEDGEETDFESLRAQPLSSLMADFGAADPDWMKQQPKTAQAKAPPSQPAEKSYEHCRLTKLGKAPVHVDFTSFGYTRGGPKEIRNGWSHSNPLAPVECRDFEPVSDYLEWQDGTSSAVRAEILNSSDGEIRVRAEKAAADAFEALCEALAAGHGYASPLTMRVYVGSESGRHRSVLFCELAATALRNLLRANENDRISTTEKISVGAYHTCVDNRRKRTARQPGQRKQHLAGDGDW